MISDDDPRVYSQLRCHLCEVCAGQDSPGCRSHRRGPGFDSPQLDQVSAVQAHFASYRAFVGLRRPQTMRPFTSDAESFDEYAAAAVVDRADLPRRHLTEPEPGVGQEPDHRSVTGRSSFRNPPPFKPIGLKEISERGARPVGRSDSRGQSECGGHLDRVGRVGGDATLLDGQIQDHAKKARGGALRRSGSLPARSPDCRRPPRRWRWRAGRSADP